MKNIIKKGKNPILFIGLAIITLAIEKIIEPTEWFRDMVVFLKFILENLTIIFIVVYITYFIWYIENKLRKINLTPKISQIEKKVPGDINEKLRIAIEYVRLLSINKINNDIKLQKGQVSKFSDFIKDEKKNVLKILIKDFDIKASEANDLVENYYKKYPI